jgi:chromosome segregation ATPase
MNDKHYTNEPPEELSELRGELNELRTNTQDYVRELLARAVTAETQARYNRALLRDERRHRASAMKALKKVAKQRDTHATRAEQAEDQRDELREQIEAWKYATGLIDSSGDPDGVTPSHLSAELSELRERATQVEAERDTYKRALLSVSTWREGAHEYDEEINEPPRDFIHEEDWDLLEEFARNILGGE